MNKRFLKTLAGTFALTTTLLLTSCYSVFSGGTGGIIVDAESTSTPKTGIPFVDVYAYTDSGTRDSAYNSWREGTVFSPSNSYYGHTTTDVNGNFTISNIVWKSDKPEFGKDADFTTIYLLYYHENYGLTKGSTVITSDSTSDTVYAELKAIRKTTALNINIIDVADSRVTSNSVLVKISVPQTTDTLTTAKAKIYEQTITGSGTINISYPRWKNQTDKAKAKENEPEVSINYAQSADTITWKACANADNEARDYSFLNDDFSIIKKIQNSNYSVSVYGKTTRIYLPSVSGIYGDSSDEASDGIEIKMIAQDKSGNFTIDCGIVTTEATPKGTSDKEKHGTFSNLGNGYFIDDDLYTDNFKTIEVQFYANDILLGTKELRSDTTSYNLNLNNL